MSKRLRRNPLKEVQRKEWLVNPGLIEFLQYLIKRCHIVLVVFNNDPSFLRSPDFFSPAFTDVFLDLLRGRYVDMEIVMWLIGESAPFENIFPTRIVVVIAGFYKDTFVFEFRDHILKQPCQGLWGNIIIKQGASVDDRP